MNKLVPLILLIMSITSCSDLNDERVMQSFHLNKEPLQIVTKTLTSQSPNLIQEFTAGSVIGLYVVSENTGDIYNGNTHYKNIRAEAWQENRKLNWEQERPVFLDSEPAIVYAYSPYQNTASFDPENIPVKVSSDAIQSIDYMYGSQTKGQKAINKISPVALLDMNHALSLLSFQIHLTPETKGCYLLSSIQVGNKAGGTTLFYRGFLNIKTGEIKRDAGNNASTRLELGELQMLTPVLSDPLQIKVMPTPQEISKGDVEVLFRINNETFTFKVPSHTLWKKGEKYQYSLSFNGKKLKLENTSISEWAPMKKKV